MERIVKRIDRGKNPLVGTIIDPRYRPRATREREGGWSVRGPDVCRFSWLNEFEHIVRRRLVI